MLRFGEAYLLEQRSKLSSLRADTTNPRTMLINTRANHKQAVGAYKEYTQARKASREAKILARDGGSFKGETGGRLQKKMRGRLCAYAMALIFV